MADLNIAPQGTSSLFTFHYHFLQIPPHLPSRPWHIAAVDGERLFYIRLGGIADCLGRCRFTAAPMSHDGQQYLAFQIVCLQEAVDSSGRRSPPHREDQHDDIILLRPHGHGLQCHPLFVIDFLFADFRSLQVAGRVLLLRQDGCHIAPSGILHHIGQYLAVAQQLPIRSATQQRSTGHRIRRFRKIRIPDPPKIHRQYFFIRLQLWSAEDGFFIDGHLMEPAVQIGNAGHHPGYQDQDQSKGSLQLPAPEVPPSLDGSVDEQHNTAYLGSPYMDRMPEYRAGARLPGQTHAHAADSDQHESKDEQQDRHRIHQPPLRIGTLVQGRIEIPVHHIVDDDQRSQHKPQDPVHRNGQHSAPQLCDKKKQEYYIQSFLYADHTGHLLP